MKSIGFGDVENTEEIRRAGHLPDLLGDVYLLGRVDCLKLVSFDSIIRLYRLNVYRERTASDSSTVSRFHRSQ